MTRFGYTLMTEQTGPRELVRDAVRAEAAGFDFEVSSDHYSPWIDSMGHAPNAWVTLGAVAQATEKVDLMTYVTCPTMRYHPAVVAQQAATLGLISDSRFTLGLGAGENLNEHIIGAGWPPVNTRHEMFADALEIITQLFTGEYVSYSGKHLSTDSAKLWDLPETRVPLALAVSGPQSIEVASRYADAMIAVEPEASLVTGFDQAAGAGKRKIAQVPISWDPDKDSAVARAHELFRWFAGGWKVNAELPSTAGFAAATQFVTPADVAENITCGPDVATHLAGFEKFIQAGFTDVAVVQVGGDTQPQFLDWAESELLPALREL